jgi:hypothetical protein
VSHPSRCPYVLQWSLQALLSEMRHERSRTLVTLPPHPAPVIRNPGSLDLLARKQADEAAYAALFIPREAIR